jgi:hypothetical protein
MSINYDQYAKQYKKYRKPDPRIAKRIHFHLQGVQSILNVGAGMGSYEPDNCKVVAIEPSYEMILRRINSGTMLIQGAAEKLPFKIILLTVRWASLPCIIGQILPRALRKCSGSRKIK